MLFWNEGFDMDANSMGKEWGISKTKTKIYGERAGISKTKTKIVLLAFLCIIDISVP
jgi:hypothetical protein